MVDWCSVNCSMCYKCEEKCNNDKYFAEHRDECLACYDACDKCDGCGGG